MEYYYLTDPGKVRDHNEDSVIICENDNGEILMAVADGMGGHKAGEVASSIAITHIGKRFRDLGSVGNKTDAVSFIKEVVSEANVLIYKYTEEHPESMGMGTTLVMALLTKEYLLFGNIGDTLVNILVKSGELTEKGAKEHPRKNVLMKALGAQTTVEMDVFAVEDQVESIMLCSDGLTNMLDFEQINKVLTEDLKVEEKVQKLICKSNNRGGTDNISVALLELEAKK